MRLRFRSLLYVALGALFFVVVTSFLSSERYYAAARYTKGKFVTDQEVVPEGVAETENLGEDYPVRPSPLAPISAAFSTSLPTSTEPSPSRESPTDAPEPQLEFDIQDGEVLSADEIVKYLEAITDNESTVLPRLGCRPIMAYRYDYLKPDTAESHYLFAINLRQVLHLLPRLLGSVIEVMRYLGPEHCALSIIEGHSDDGTQDILEALDPILDGAGIRYFYQRSDINPATDDRIGRLAKLRNLALQPLLNLPDLARDPTFLFLNDVAICSNDILELAHQKRHLGADMTCAMDWTHVAPEPSFYDVWIARGMNGDTFFHIPLDGSWDGAWELFWNDKHSRMRVDGKRPFQVFACWNGAVAFTGKPLRGEGAVAFRASFDKGGECYQGEPLLFCKDFWFRGHGKIAVVPSVNLEYSDETGEMIKREKGWTEEIVAEQDPDDDLIDWTIEPPPEIKCAPGWQNQHWQKWDQGLL